jgi:hypothetical protein
MPSHARSNGPRVKRDPRHKHGTRRGQAPLSVPHPWTTARLWRALSINAALERLLADARARR